MEMHNPPHPGRVLKNSVLRQDGGISVTEFAEKLGMTRTAISRVVNGKAAISAELAVRLAAFLGGSARSWLNMQTEYDLWQIRNKRRPKIERLIAA
jgi:addiction module HigA family antidote